MATNRGWAAGSPVASVTVIDLRRLRDDDEYRAGALRKGADAETVEQSLDAADSRSSIQREVETLRAEQNAASKAIGRAEPDEREAKIAAAAELKASLQEREGALAEVAARVDELEPLIERALISPAKVRSRILEIIDDNLARRAGGDRWLNRCAWA